MPGDDWQKLANLRLLLTYMLARPGKKLLFMGTELAPWSEWNHDVSLPWQLGDDPQRAAFARYMEELGRVYQSSPAFWRLDHEPDGFTWVVVNDSTNSVFAYARAAGDERRLVVLNMTPVPRDGYRIGCPGGSEYELVLSSDAERFGGSGYAAQERVMSESVPFHGFTDSIVLSLPPLGALILAPVEPRLDE
jgi:1,4-alpha-glucan branching enzyme